jgi:hypothetical protein
MASLRVGTVVLVQYADEVEWHERLVCAWVRNNLYLVVTPDYDYFMEELSVHNPDLQGVRFYLGKGVVPLGVEPGSIYAFPALPQDERTQLIAEGNQVGQQEALRLGLPPLAGPIVAPGVGIRRPSHVSPPLGPEPVRAPGPIVACDAVAVLPPVPLVVPLVASEVLQAPGVVVSGDAARALRSEVCVLGPLSAAPAGMAWVALEDGPAGVPAFGEVVSIGPGAAVIHAVLGRRSLATLASGSHIALGLVDTLALPRFEVLFRGDDARTLPIRLRGGARHRDWVDVMGACKEEKFADWPFPVRTAAWCGNYMTRDGGPRMHFESWKARRRLNDDEWGVDMYEVLSDVLEALGCYDQGDMTNLLAAEKIVRHLQLIEHFYDDKKSVGQGSASKVPRDERQAFLGGGRPASMVSPALLDHVSKELDRVGNIKKNARKLREEEADRHKDNRDNNKNKNKDKKKEAE